MRKLGAKMALVLARATWRQHQLSMDFRPNLFGEKHSGAWRGPWDMEEGGGACWSPMCPHASAGSTSFSEPQEHVRLRVTEMAAALLSAGSVASRSRMDFGPWLGSSVVRALSHYAKVVGSMPGQGTYEN